MQRQPAPPAQPQPRLEQVVGRAEQQIPRRQPPQRHGSERGDQQPQRVERDVEPPAERGLLAEAPRE
jgi:hypothetical protein